MSNADMPMLTPIEPTSGLTGRYRFRPGLFGAVVVEVEFHWTGSAPYSVRVRTEQRWRDANFDDLLDPKLRSLINGRGI